MELVRDEQHDANECVTLRRDEDGVGNVGAGAETTRPLQQLIGAGDR